MDACRVFNRTSTIYVAVENGTFLGLLECGVQGQKAVAFPPQTIHPDEMELSLITFPGDFNCVLIWQHSIGPGMLCVHRQVMICKCR